MDRDQERKLAGSYRVGVTIFGMVFAIFWCCAAAAMGAWFMLIFGIPFVGMMVFQLVLSIKIMKQERRRDDPWDRGTTNGEPPVRPGQQTGSGGSGYCPYCGGEIAKNFEFCPKCGRRLP